MHVIAAKAIALKEASTDEFKVYQHSIVKNASILADQLIAEGLELVSGGTDNHLMLIDLSKMEINGKQAETLLDKAGITANKNVIPFDKRSPMTTSGIRVGTPVLTTRGIRDDEMKVVGKLIADLLKAGENESLIESTRKKVRELCEAFPLFTELEA